MISLHLAEAEMSAALARGVRQCVLIGPPPPPLRAALEDPVDQTLQVFAVDEPQAASEALATSLEKSNFDNLKATLFVWLGGAGYRTVDGVLAALSFIASRPQGSAVIFDYVVERTCHEEPAHNGLGIERAAQRTEDCSSWFAARSLALRARGSFTHTALDALASRICAAGGSVKLLIQPQAVAAMLYGAGFRKIIDLASDESHLSGGHLVTAMV
jgi:O-methyltransferase involved in polyketide biosynthesis